MTPVTGPRKNEIAALGLINWYPMHGYALNQKIQELGLEQWANLSQSSVYYALGKLTEAGAVSVTTEKVGNSPERTIFHITPEGRTLLADQLRMAMAKIESDDLLFYLAISFIDALPVVETISLLTNRFARLNKISATEKCHGQKKSIAPHFQALCRAGATHMAVERDFCQELIDLFTAQPDYFDQFKPQGGDGDA